LRSELDTNADNEVRGFKIKLLERALTLVHVKAKNDDVSGGTAVGLGSDSGDLFVTPHDLKSFKEVMMSSENEEFHHLYLRN